MRGNLYIRLLQLFAQIQLFQLPTRRSDRQVRGILHIRLLQLFAQVQLRIRVGAPDSLKAPPRQPRDPSPRPSPRSSPQIAGNAPSTVVISDTDQSRSKFSQMSSRTGQSERLLAAEMLGKSAEIANEPRTASNKTVIWKGHGNVNL